MPTRIPVSAARGFSLAHNCTQIIILAWDGTLTHCVTWGKSVEDCAQAALGGNKLKEALGWPKHLQQEPPRVKSLQLANRALELRLVAALNSLRNLRGLEMLDTRDPENCKLLLEDNY